MRLTDSQLDDFKTNGYLILRDFVSAELCDEIKNIAKAQLDARIAPIETELEYGIKSKEERKIISDGGYIQSNSEPTVRRLRQVYHRDSTFKQWMEDRKIRPILQQILNDDVDIILAHHNSIMTKMPDKSTQTMWHQDFRYWSYSNDNLVSVWLALDEESSDNGVLEFIPGSHKMKFTAEQFDKKEYFSEELEKNKEIISTKVSTSLHKGDVVLFHCKLLHRANKNSTSKPKISFVYTVKAANNDALPGTRSTEYPEVELR